MAASAILHCGNVEMLLTDWAEMPDFVKIGQCVAEKLSFRFFSRWRLSVNMVIKNLLILLADGVLGAEMIHFVKFSQNESIRQSDGSKNAKVLKM